MKEEKGHQMTQNLFGYQSVDEERERIESEREPNRHPRHLSDGDEGEPDGEMHDIEEAGSSVGEREQNSQEEEAGDRREESSRIKSYGEAKGDYSESMVIGSRRRVIETGSRGSVKPHYDHQDDNVSLNSIPRWADTLLTSHRLIEEETLSVATELRKRVVGQDRAVDAVLPVVLRSRAGFQRPEQPIGSFLFLGPNGVGKTELAKALTQQLFGNEDHLVQIDMSEYTEAHSVARLIGAARGYYGGQDEGGQLTEAVRQRPNSVVLIKRVEKAHAAVLNALLKVLRDGRLTDGQGLTVDFRNTVIIMTSNLGDQDLFYGDTATAHDRVMYEARKHFRPELLNQLDKTVIFDPPSRTSLARIANIEISNATAFLRERGYGIFVTDPALRYMADQGYDRARGVCSIRRWIDWNVTTDLSIILSREKMKPHSMIRIDAGKSGLVYELYRFDKNGEMVKWSSWQKSGPGQKFLGKISKEDTLR